MTAKGRKDKRFLFRTPLCLMEQICAWYNFHPENQASPATKQGQKKNMGLAPRAWLSD